ncbi:MAG: DHHA1 domain-containing protein, partial [Pseudothermotoga sp.]
VKNTGNIGLFKIISESAISAGTRRIEAVTGLNALSYLRTKEQLIKNICEIFDTSQEDLLSKIENLIEKHHGLQKEIEQLRLKLLISQLKQAPVEQVKSIKFLHTIFDGIESNDLRSLSDVAVSGQGSMVALLFSVSENKVNLIVRVTSDLTKKIKAGDIAKQAAQILGGGGGGRPDFAQAGGKGPEKIKNVIECTRKLLEQF